MRWLLGLAGACVPDFQVPCFTWRLGTGTDVYIASPSTACFYSWSRPPKILCIYFWASFEVHGTRHKFRIVLVAMNPRLLSSFFETQVGIAQVLVSFYTQPVLIPPSKALAVAEAFAGPRAI